MNELRYHIACKHLPPASPEEIRELGEDIRDNGLKEPIELWKGYILNGRARHEACQRYAPDKLRTINLPQKLPDHYGDPHIYAISQKVSNTKKMPTTTKAFWGQKIKMRLLKLRDKGILSGSSDELDRIAGQFVEVSGASINRCSSIVKSGTKELKKAVFVDFIIGLHRGQFYAQLDEIGQASAVENSTAMKDKSRKGRTAPRKWTVPRTKQESLKKISELGKQIGELLTDSSSYTLKYNRVKDAASELVAIISSFDVESPTTKATGTSQLGVSDGV